MYKIVNCLLNFVYSRNFVQLINGLTKKNGFKYFLESYLFS